MDHAASRLPWCGDGRGQHPWELGARGIATNPVNPGSIDIGWMIDDVRALLLARTPPGRLGAPTDTAALVALSLSARRHPDSPRRSKASGHDAKSDRDQHACNDEKCLEFRNS